MTLDPPAAAARRQWAIDRIVESLVEWGCPADGAEHRARVVLEHAMNAGYALPASMQPHTSGPVADPDTAHAWVTRIRADLEARRMGREAAQPPAEDDAGTSPVSQEPRNRPSASQGVAP